MAIFENSLDMAKTQVTLRALRYGHFPADIFDEYAWDMMLHLYIAGLRRQTIYLDNVINMTSKNRTIGDRWIKHLCADGIVEMEDEVVRLTVAGFQRMDEYHEQALAAVSVTRMASCKSRPCRRIVVGPSWSWRTETAASTLGQSPLRFSR